jgi:hypothetical protein
VLAYGVRLLPAGRTEWGRAMLAELAAIEGTPDRWRFALSCTRSVLSGPSTLLALAGRLLIAAVVVGAIVLAGGIRFAGVRREMLAMVAVLVAVSGLARRAAVFGPVAASRTARVVSAGGLAVIAAEALIFINDARLSPASNVDGPDLASATALIGVWTVMLTIYTLALARMTARRSALTTHTLAAGAAAAIAAAAAWLIAAVVDPSVPTSSRPALLAVGAAAVCAAVLGTRRGRGAQHRLAGLSAAAGAALLIAVMIDGPLRIFPAWVPNSAPPIDPATADRLVDPIGIWLLGCLLATAVLVGRATPRRDADAVTTTR